MDRDDDIQDDGKLGGWFEDDVEEPDFEGETQAGGWWSGDLERRADPRSPFNVRVEVVPPDGVVHECNTINISMGGTLLEKTNSGPLPELGQMVVIEICDADNIEFDGLVVRVEPDPRRFAAQFVNLDHRLRQYLNETVSTENEDSPSAYLMSKPPGDRDG